MKAGALFILAVLMGFNSLFGQRNCYSYTYQQAQFAQKPGLKQTVTSLENFAGNYIANRIAGRLESAVIKIPVVVHVLYHQPSEKISDALVQSQIDVLNTCFRKLNSDTANIPQVFKSLAADCEIEFQLASSDPQKRYTTGIVKKYTPIAKWKADDKMKFSAEMGDDAWDPDSYLNIWVCNMDKYAGYSSLPGDDKNIDGVVIGFPAFGVNDKRAGYGLGKTAVHEIGHWLNLKHIWGDTYCGDDGVSDTPKQADYTPGCPSGVRITCGNSPTGDMYNNYMDLTSDPCINMFTEGQKTRMRAMFEPGGIRYPLLFSKGLNTPLIFETPLPDDDPKWLEPRIYPNPATNELTIDLTYDARWVGNYYRVTNLQGQVLLQGIISSKLQKIYINRLKPGMYFLAAKKGDGVSIKQKFIKL